MWLNVLGQRMRDLIKLWCCRRPAGGKQMSTGHLYSNRFESQPCKKSPTAKAVRDFLAEDEGFDLIKERLGQALAGGARPRRI